VDPSVLISFLLNLDPGKTKLYLRKHHLQNITIMSIRLLYKRWKPSIICTFLIWFYDNHMGFLCFFLGIITLTKSKMAPVSCQSSGKYKEFEYNFLKICRYICILPLFQPLFNLPPSLNLIVIKFQSSNQNNCVLYI